MNNFILLYTNIKSRYRFNISLICYNTQILVPKRFGSTVKDVSNTSRTIIIYAPRPRVIIPYVHIPHRNLPVVVNTPISFVCRPLLPQRRQFEEWERNTPEYNRAMMNRFPPRTIFRVYNNPYINCIHNEIIAFMRRYFDLGMSSIIDIINLFRTIQFEPNQVGSELYNRYMELSQRFWNQTSSLISFSSFSSTDSPIVSISTTYGTSTFDFDLENFIDSTCTTITTTTTTSSTILSQIEEDQSNVNSDNKPNISYITTDMLKKELNKYLPDNFDSLTQKEQNKINPFLNPTSPPDTMIIQGLVARDITDLQIIIEGIRRGLLKINDSKTDTSFLTNIGESIVVGKTNVDVKQTPLFNTYVKMVKKPIVVEEITSENEESNFCIGVVPVDNSKTLLPSSKHKHALLILSDDKKTYRIYGYFTSKKSNVFVSKTQFKPYQNQQSSQIMSINKKDQYLLKLPNVEIVSADKVVVLAYGEEYIQSLSKEIFSQIKDELDAKPSVKFDIEGHTKQDLIDIYLAFDAIIKNKGKQPKPEDFEIISNDKYKPKDINDEKT
jgi:hypothetical protein